MNKQHILAFIQKYSLGGNIESVAWESNGALKTKLISDDKNLLGSVEYHALELKEFEGAKLGVYKTSALVKLLGVLEDEVEIKLNTTGEKPISIRFEDKNGTRVNYALSDLVVIQNVPALKYEPSEYDVVIKIDENFSNLFNKVKNAMTEVVNFTVHATAKKVEFVFGQTDVNTNLTVLNIESEKTSAIDKQVFDANLFKEILNANKGLESKFNISKEGLAKIVFKNDDYTATYYLVAKSAD